MTSATEVDRVEVHVLVDNVTDSLSTVPSNVENEWSYLWRNGMKRLSGRCRRELCRNSSGAISGMNIVLGQATRSIVSFVTDAGESVFQPSTLRMVI